MTVITIGAMAMDTVIADVLHLTQEELKRKKHIITTRGADMNLVVIMQEEAATIQCLHTTRVEVMIIQLLHKIRAEVTTIRLLRTTLAEAMIRLRTILAEATTVVAVVAPLLEGEGTRHWYY